MGILSRLRASSDNYHQSRFCYIYWLTHLSSGCQVFYLTNYFVRIDNNENVLMLYFAIMYMVSPFVMHVIETIRVSSFTVFRFSVLLHGAVYLLMMLDIRLGVGMVVPLSVLSSIAVATYNISFYALLTDLSSEQTRDHLLGKALAGANVVALVLPSIAGLVLRGAPRLLGYVVISVGSLLLGAVALLVSRNISFPETERPAGRHKVNWREILRNEPSVKQVVALCILRSVRDGSFLFVINMMLLSIIKDESLIGFNTSLSSIGMIAGNMLYARTVVPHRRRGSLAVSSVVLLVLSGVLVLRQSIAIVICFSLFNALLTSFGTLPTTSCELDFISGLTKKYSLTLPKLLALREYVVSAGRLLGTLLVLVFSRSASLIPVAIFIIFAIQLLSLCFMPHTAKAKLAEMPV